MSMKKIIIASVVLSALVFLFAPQIPPMNLKLPEIFNAAADKDVIIIFNSGGWGNTSPEEAKDFAPIVEGIQKTLNEWGRSSIIIPYVRTKEGLLGQITGAKEMFNSFKNSSEELAVEIEELAKKFPDKKIIMTGLSNGAAFANKTYENISNDFKKSVYVITMGNPFWENFPQSDNLLQLDNNGKDILSKGDAKSLLYSLIKAPLKWIFSKITGENLNISQAFEAFGHYYFCPSPEVNSQIVSFLQNKLH